MNKEDLWKGPPLTEEERDEHYAKMTKIYDERGHNYYSPTTITIPYVRKHACGNSVLDLGCGDGRVLRAVDDLFDVKVGVDMSKVRLDYAIAHTPNAKFYHRELTEFLKECDDKFDTIMMFEVLEHLVNDLEIFDLASRICNHIIVATVPLNMPGDTHYRAFRKIDEVKKRFNADQFELNKNGKFVLMNRKIK